MTAPACCCRAQCFVDWYATGANWAVSGLLSSAAAPAAEVAGVAAVLGRAAWVCNSTLDNGWWTAVLSSHGAQLQCGCSSALIGGLRCCCQGTAWHQTSDATSQVPAGLGGQF